MSLFRYPGGKSKLLPQLTHHLYMYSKQLNLEYREPFFGGGSVGLKFLKDHPHWNKIWINDKDKGISSLWEAVLRYPRTLKYWIRNFTPSVESFDYFKHRLIQNEFNPEEDIALQGFMKLALHQISYSGLGTKSGGPLGGREQTSKYPIDCRWSPNRICSTIDKLHKLFSQFEVRVTSLDFNTLISGTGALIYLDPPYYDKGNDLYQCGFTENDHKRLAESLRRTCNSWILSYDDCPEVRALYDWAKVEVVNVNYSITGKKSKTSNKRLSRVKPELIIYPQQHQHLLNDKKNILGFTV